MAKLGTSGLLLFLVVASGCTDPSEPSTISAAFELTDVDGLPLPVSAPPSVGLPGPTIISGSMSLDLAGGAHITEDRRDSQGTQYTFTSTYTYTIHGSNIEFVSASCPIDANCAAPPVGEIIDNTLRVQLTYPPGYPFHVFTYRHMPTG
jgi:hypothetical protein